MHFSLSVCGKQQTAKWQLPIAEGGICSQVNVEKKGKSFQYSLFSVIQFIVDSGIYKT